MPSSDPAQTAARRPRSHELSCHTPSSTPATPTTGITVYGCGQDEAVVFRELAPSFGVTATITAAPASEANAELAHGNRCISVGH